MFIEDGRDVPVVDPCSKHEWANCSDALSNFLYGGGEELVVLGLRDLGAGLAMAGEEWPRCRPARLRMLGEPETSA
jgi:hypothetical protein